MKNYQEWTNSKLPASQFLQYGDIVCEDIAEYFISVLPPVFWSDKIIQMGEPYNHNSKGQAQYLTLAKISDNWVYTGINPKGIANEPKN